MRDHDHGGFHRRQECYCVPSQIDEADLSGRRLITSSAVLVSASASRTTGFAFHLWQIAGGAPWLIAKVGRV